MFPQVSDMESCFLVLVVKLESILPFLSVCGHILFLFTQKQSLCKVVLEEKIQEYKYTEINKTLEIRKILFQF